MPNNSTRRSATSEACSRFASLQIHPNTQRSPPCRYQTPSHYLTGHRNASQSDCSTEITMQNKEAGFTRVARVKKNVFCTGRWTPATHRGAFMSNAADFKRHALRLNWHWLACLSENVRFSPTDTHSTFALT